MNFGTQSLLHLVGGGGVDRLLAAVAGESLRATNLVVELTEHERVGDMRALRGVVDALRGPWRCHRLG